MDKLVVPMALTEEILSFSDFSARKPARAKRYKPRKEIHPAGNAEGKQKTKKIGIISAMGAGKSTLINELLCVENLCKTSSGLTACTQVAVSYHHYEFAGQNLNKSEVRAEVDLLTKTDFNILRSAFKSEVVEEYKECKLRKLATSQAETYLTAVRDLALRTHEFDTAEATTRAEISTDDAAEFRRQFDILTEAAIARVLADEGETQHTLEFHCGDLQMLRKKLDVYECGERTCVVKCIRIYVQDTILKDGCILVDLPGLDNSSILSQFSIRENRAADIYFILIDPKLVKRTTTILAEIRKAVLLTAHGARDVLLIVSKPELLVQNGIEVRAKTDSQDTPPFPAIKAALAKNEQPPTSAHPQQKEKKENQTTDSDAESSDEEVVQELPPERTKYQEYLLNFAKKAIIRNAIKEITEWAAATFSDEGGHVRVFMAATHCHIDLRRRQSCASTDRLVLTPEETGLPAIRRFLKTINTD